MGYAVGNPVVWPFLPDWSNPVNESLAWLSDFMQALTGSAQVRGLRDAPRRTFSFSGIVDGDARRIVDGIRFDTGIKQILLPIAPDIQFLTADLASGTTAIPCRTDGFDFVAGGTAMLWRDQLTWELVTVDTVGTDSLTLSAPTASSWANGSRVYPIRKARLQGAPQASYKSDEVSTVDAAFQIDEPCDWPAAFPTATTYRGQPVLEWRNEESEEPKAQYDRLSDSVDMDVGPVFWFDLPDMPFRAQTQRFALQGRDDHSQFRSLLYALNGRTTQLWVPSWIADLRVTQAIGASDTQLHVPWMGYYQFGYQQANRRDIAIELYDGTRLYRRITGSAEASGAEVLQIDSALGQAIDPGAIRQIGWLTCCASGSDAFSIQHVNDADGSAIAGINWQAVKSDV